jgi:hypothetical protein
VYNDYELNSQFKWEGIEMDDMITFLQTLKEGDGITFILPIGLIVGGVKTKFDLKIDCIEISEVYVNGIYTSTAMTIPVKNILGWGKTHGVN